MTGNSAAPIPQGLYMPAKRHGALIFTAGMTPRKNGELLFHGPVPSSGALDIWREPAILACHNALMAAQAMLSPGETIGAILSMTVYVAAENGFTAHSRIADFASEYLRAELGVAGSCARCAIGVATLPGNAPLEISLIATAN